MLPDLDTPGSRMRRHRHHARRSISSSETRRGFTIVELLTTIGAIVLLIAIVIHAATAAKTGADRATESVAARTLGVAWTTYATDHRGAILPGYAEGFRARGADGEWIDTQTVPVAAKRWPLRLAPYLGHDLASFYSGPEADRVAELADAPSDEALYAVSAYPSFGLNSVFVGGDENHGGFSPIFEQTFGRFYATRLSTVRHPDRLTVFATSRTDEAAPGVTGDIREGFFRVLPPSWASPLWSDVYDPEDPASAGFLSPRHAQHGDDVAITTTVDGAVSTATIDELRDMRRWSDQATSADWRMVP